MVFFDEGVYVKIVRINHRYREYLKEVDKHFQYEGIGILAQSSGNFYYLPLTSKIEESLPNHHMNYKVEIIMDRKKRPLSTIEIRDYYFVDQMLVTSDVEMTELEQQEAEYIRKNKKSINNKLKKMIMSSRRRHDKVVKLYEEYYEKIVIL